MLKNGDTNGMEEIGKLQTHLPCGIPAPFH